MRLPLTSRLSEKKADVAEPTNLRNAMKARMRTTEKLLTDVIDEDDDDADDDDDAVGEDDETEAMIEGRLWRF